LRDAEDESKVSPQLEANDASTTRGQQCLHN